MRTEQSSQKGMAAVEMALILPLVAVLLFVLVEGANALRTYSSLQDASREGARLVLRDGASADVQNLVRSLFPDLETAALTATSSVDATAHTVTVEVSYVYTPFSGSTGSTAQDAFGNTPYVFAARTTLPLP